MQSCVAWPKPRFYLSLTEAVMAERVKQAVSDLRGTKKNTFTV
jgi:hypothetical protein